MLQAPQLPSSIERTVGSQAPPLSMGDLLWLLGLGCVLSLLTAWHFRRFGSTLANRTEFARVIPFVVLTTVLIISVVKSQLALSLGMVGALSIVRFRTPVKEPEELAYLFLALAIGVGLGANQWQATTAAAGVILALMALLKVARRGAGTKNLYLSIDVAGAPPESALTQLNALIGAHAVACDLRRYDVREASLAATYFVDIEDAAALDRVASSVRAAFPGAAVSFLDQSRLPNV